MMREDSAAAYGRVMLTSGGRNRPRRNTRSVAALPSWPVILVRTSENDSP